MKTLIRIVPFVVLVLQVTVVVAASENTQDIFTKIYTANAWNDPHSHSGTGSNLVQTKTIRQEIPLLCKKLGIRTFLDAPCGDFYWMKEVDLDIEHYIGIDIVPNIIEDNKRSYETSNCTFIHLDILKNVLPCADIILCRDCLVHFSFADIFLAIKNFKKSNATYLLTTTFPGEHYNNDIKTGDWRPLNLEKPPFNFPKPLLISESCTEQGGATKSLGLWLLDDLMVG